MHLEEIIKSWKIECIIFDLDGTLVDTLDQHIKAFEILFKREKITIETKRIAQNMGRTPKDTLLTLLPNIKHDKEKLSHLANEKEKILTTLLENIGLFDGVYEVLEYLKTLKIPLCIASSTPSYNVEKILKKTNLIQYFDVVITGEDITIGKPNPEVFLKAAKKANIPPQHTLVIGDSPHDIVAAKRANMKIIITLTGIHSELEIKKASPNLTFKNLIELIN